MFVPNFYSCSNPSGLRVAVTDSPPGSHRVTPSRHPSKPNFSGFSALYFPPSQPLSVHAPDSYRLSSNGSEELESSERESLQHRPFGGEVPLAMSPGSTNYIPALVPEAPRRIQYPSSPSSFMTLAALRLKRAASEAAPPEVVPNLLSPALMKDLILHGLPLLHRFQRWERMYSLLRDGSSQATFARNAQGRARTLLVVKAATGEVFGAYAASPWRHEKKSSYVGSKFYGTGECFLFRKVERGKNLRRGLSFLETPGADSVEVFKWTGANLLCQYFDQEEGRLAMGGGGEAGMFGLCLEDDFSRGSTGPTATFGNNEGLLGRGRWDFDILGVELYGFVE